MTSADSDFSVHQILEKIAHLLESGQTEQAHRLCDDLLQSCAANAADLLRISHVYQRMGRFESMVDAAERAAGLSKNHIASQRRLVECYVYSGRIDLARQRLLLLEQEFQDSPEMLLLLAELHAHCDSHLDVYRCSARAATLWPEHPGAIYAQAAAAVSVGKIDEAQTLFERVIKLSPSDADAYVNRASLRTWGHDNHHVDELKAALNLVSPQGRVAVCYALAKELEDLGDFEASFSYLRRGADMRRAQMAYRVDQDVQSMKEIARVFDARTLDRASRPVADECSVFVLGLPRSGTTLVERILSSHSQVDSVGETSVFAYALMRLSGFFRSKLELIERSAHLDFEQLGHLHRAGVRSYGLPGPRLIDKTPANFLYLGAIRCALPGSRVIHLRRHPLDSCYAMYKTLFRMGYPFSYDLRDLGQYYVAYHRLMEHWREVMPGFFLDLRYEDLVHDQEAGTRQILQHCGLEWEPQCLEFHANAMPSATASAAQVRKPIYKSSVARWRDYEKQLTPLAEYLTAQGIDCT